MLTLAIALWVAATIASWISRRGARRTDEWLRSAVPTKVAYARLRAEIERNEASSS